MPVELPPSDWNLLEGQADKPCLKLVLLAGVLRLAGVNAAALRALAAVSVPRSTPSRIEPAPGLGKEDGMCAGFETWVATCDSAGSSLEDAGDAPKGAEIMGDSMASTSSSTVCSVGTSSCTNRYSEMN